MEEPNYPDFSQEFQPRALEEEYVRKRLSFELPGWKIVKSPQRENPLKEQMDLFRRFEFQSFKAVTEFISDMNTIAEVIMHHPRIENMYTSLDVYLSTWGIGHRITIKDILFAKNLDTIYKEKYGELTPKAWEISEDYINAIKELIAENKLQEAVENLDEYFVINASITAPDEIILFKKRIKDLNSELRRGTISQSEFRLEENKIASNFLDYLPSTDA